MIHGIYAQDFAKILSKLLEENNISCYSISQFSGLDQAYLSRLRAGQKDNPSSATVIKISLALAHLGKNIKLHDIKELFHAAGRSIES
jgi:predicted transcriptional regulator